MRIHITMFIFLFVFIGFQILLLSPTCYVDNGNTSDPCHGSQEHPFQYIQSGVDAASDEGTILVMSENKD